MRDRTAFRSAFRNQRAPGDRHLTPEVSSPVGGGTSMTAADQAHAIRSGGKVPGEEEELDSRFYTDWYDLPAMERMSRLGGSR